MEKSTRASLRAIEDEIRGLYSRLHREEISIEDFERAASELECRRKELMG